MPFNKQIQIMPEISHIPAQTNHFIKKVAHLELELLK